MGGGGKSQTSTSTVSIPPEVLARYNAVNARAETAATTPFQPYQGEFVAPLNATQQAGIGATSAYSQAAQPYYGAAAGLTLGAAQPVGPLTQGQIGYYQNPYTEAVVGSTLGALGQQFGQQQSQQQADAIKAGAFGGERAGLQRAQLMGQQGLAAAQAISPLYQQGYQQAVQTAGQQQGVIASDLARQMAAGQQIGGLGSAAQAAALQGAQAQIGAGTLGQQTQQAQDTAVYQQYLQQQGYPFQVAQFLANIAEGTGALSGSTTTSTQPTSFFSDRRLKHDAKKIGETKDGLPIYSFKYNGDDRTQIGLMAQDVEKKHPEAVGEAGGYKTVDYEKALHPAKKAYGGGLDPSSMGGVVSEPGAFMRGGYISGGAVDPNDISAILAQQRQSFGPFAQHGLYAGSASGMPGGAGGAGVVPQQQMHVPKLMTAGAPPKPADSEFSQIYQGYKGLNDITSDMTGTSLSRRAGNKLLGTDAVPARTDAQGNVSAAQPAQPGLLQRGWDAVTNSLSSEQPSERYRGGLVRHHYEDGGDIEPYDLTNPSKGYLDKTVKEGDAEKNRSLAVAGKGPGVGPSGASQLSSALGLGNAAMNFGSGVAGLFDAGGGAAADALPEVMAGLLSTGGVVPRQHFKDGSNVLPSADVVDRQPGLVPVTDNDADTGIPPQMQALAKDVDVNAAGDAAVPFIIGKESGGDPTARNRTSSAAGLGQFTDSTAKTVISRHPDLVAGVDYDPNVKGFAATLPADIQQKMVQAHARDQAKLLSDRGFDPTPQNIYVNHFLGEAGGPNFLARMMQDPDAPAHSLVGSDQVRGNQNIFFDRQGNPRTAAQVYDIMGGKAPAGGLGSARMYAGAQPTTMTDGKDTGFFGGLGMNKQTILPILEGLGAMAGSKSRFLGSAILEGLGAGAKAYGDVAAQQAGIGSTEATTKGTEALTQGYLTNNMQKAIQNVPGLGPVYWVIDPKTNRPTPLTFAEHNRRVQAGEQFQYINAVPGSGGNVSPATTNVGAGTTGGPGSENVGAQPSPPPLQASVKYGDLSKSAALADAPGARSGNFDTDRSEGASYMKDVRTNAQAARAISPYTKELGNVLVKTNQDGSILGAPGFAFDSRAGTASFLNLLSRAALGNDHYFSGAEEQNDLAKKITNLQAALRAASGGQHSYASLSTFGDVQPDPSKAPEASADILAQLMVDQKKAKDVEQHALKYYGDSNGGSMYGHAIAFERENPDENYMNQKNQIKKMILSSLNPANQGKASAFSLLANGQINQKDASRDLAKLGYDPNLINYFYTGQ